MVPPLLQARKAAAKTKAQSSEGPSDNTATATATPTATATTIPNPTAATATATANTTNLFGGDRAKFLSTNSVLSRMVASEDDDGHAMSDECLLDNILALFLAGQETTASTMCNLLALLANFPEWEKRLREEQR